MLKWTIYLKWVNSQFYHKGQYDYKFHLQISQSFSKLNHILLKELTIEVISTKTQMTVTLSRLAWTDFIFCLKLVFLINFWIEGVSILYFGYSM